MHLKKKDRQKEIKIYQTALASRRQMYQEKKRLRKKKKISSRRQMYLRIFIQACKRRVHSHTDDRRVRGV
jgi:hypothetical protein